MKKSLTTVVSLIVVFMVALIITGAGIFPYPVNKSLTPAGNFVQEGTPSAQNVYSSTKKAIKISTKSINGLHIQANAAVNQYLNGTGSPWPIASGVLQRTWIYGKYSTLVFTAPSSASATKNKIYTQTL